MQILVQTMTAVKVHGLQYTTLKMKILVKRQVTFLIKFTFECNRLRISNFNLGLDQTKMCSFLLNDMALSQLRKCDLFCN